MPKLIKPSSLERDIIEFVDNKCKCSKCKPNGFFSMTPFHLMKRCKKDEEIVTRFPGRITCSICVLEFSEDEFIPLPDWGFMKPIPKQTYEFFFDDKKWVYRGVWVITVNHETPLIHECSVDWIDWQKI